MPIYVDKICDYCKKTFKRRLNQTHHETNLIYCSKKCYSLSHQNRINEPCGHCGKLITKVVSIKNGSKSNLVFCNSSCAASYNNKKRIKTRRSKCEKLLCDLLIQKFPDLDILANDKTMLNGYEADIAIPSLKLAIEWNGAVHFKPIYGEEKLQRIQTIDKLKLELANKLDINLIVIPDLVSTVKYVHQIFNNISVIITQLLII